MLWITIILLVAFYLSDKDKQDSYSSMSEREKLNRTIKHQLRNS